MDDDGAVGQVIGLELALLSPEVRRCPSRVEELLDPEFREVGASGRVWNREEIVAALAAGTADDAAIEATEMRGAVVAPGLVFLSYVSDPRGRAARRTSLWRRSEGAWRLLHHQGTQLPSDWGLATGPGLRRLATYGSLVPGRPNAHQLDGLAGSWSEGEVYGTLVEDGWGAAMGHPGLVLDPHGQPVPVHVFESADLPAHWNRLDQFEGPGYRRVVTNVRTTAGDVPASIYVLA